VAFSLSISDADAAGTIPARKPRTALRERKTTARSAS
jgi:hypothetical protein